jgi:ABC-type antimicrobial peptide transport system permease subunit
MQDCLLPIIGISPLIIAGAIAFLCSQSWLSVLVVLVGALVGAILVVPSGIFWLQILHRNWIESQAAGFIFVPIILPVYGYLGAVAGASLVAILYGYHENDLPIFVFQAIASCFTVGLSGFIPAAVSAIPSFAPFAPEANKEVEGFAIVLICAICVGLASSWLASRLAYFFVIQFV